MCLRANANVIIILELPRDFLRRKKMMKAEKQQPNEWQPSKITTTTTMNNNFHNFSAFDTPYSMRCVCVHVFRVFFSSSSYSSCYYHYIGHAHTTSPSLSLALLLLICFIVQPTRNSPFTNWLSLQFFTLANRLANETNRNRTKQNGMVCFSAYVLSFFSCALAMNLCYFNIRFCDTEECISGKMNTIS